MNLVLPGFTRGCFLGEMATVDIRTLVSVLHGFFLLLIRQEGILLCAGRGALLWISLAYGQS